MFTDPDDLDWRDRIDCYIFTIPSIFSFLGCVFVVLSIAKIKKLQTLTFMIIAFQMTAEGLYNLTQAMFFYPPKDKSVLCNLEAYMQAWTLNVMILLTAFMSYHMYHCITRKSPTAYMLTSRRLYATTGLVALYSTIVATVPLFRNNYGLLGSQCWLVKEHTHVEHTIYTTGLLYGPLWVCIGYAMFSYITIIKYVRKVHRMSSVNVNGTAESRPRSYSSSNQTENVVWKLMYYPAIMMLCWTGITLIRIYGMVYPGHQEKSIYMWLAHGTVQLQGVMDTAVFVSYPSVQKEYRELYQRYFVRAVVDDPEDSGRVNDYVEKQSDISLATMTTVISEERNPMTVTMTTDTV